MPDPTMSTIVFAREVLRRPLWIHQEAAVRSKAFVVSIAGGRRSGKTHAVQAKALHVAATNRDARVLVVSPAIENSRNFLRDLSDLVQGSRLRGSVTDDQTQVITFTNGSEIRCVAATAAQVRGRGRNLRLVIVDEAAFVPGQVWRDLFYTLFDLRSQGSQAYLVCSPWGPPEHFFRQSFERGMQGDPDYQSFRWSMLDNPTLSKDFIARERERIAPSEAAAEIDGEWSSAIGSLFTQQTLEAATADVVIPSLAELHGPARGILGADWGVSFDQCAGVGIFRLPVTDLNPDLEPAPHFIALPWTWPAGSPLHRVVDELVPASGNFRCISSETNGVGAGPTQDLFRRARRANPHVKFVWNGVTTTAASKTAAYSALLNLIERGRMVLPRHPGLLRQLAGLRFEQGQRGFMHIEAEDAAVHDDVCDALMLAALPFRSPAAKRVICRLSTLADPRRMLLDQSVPELESPVVTTGAGLRAYERPPLQSVHNREVSLYAKPLPPKPQGIQAGRFLFKTTRQEITR